MYHVTVRGNDRRSLFRDDADRNRLIRILAESVASFEIRLYLYCLMTNHVHPVVETPRANLGRFMHRVQTAYTVYFNHRHRRHGHLTQGRYGARLVAEDAYILKLSRYVHLNPVFIVSMRRQPVAERLALLRQYPWSSYPGYIGRSRRLAFVDYAPILAMMSPDESRQARTYRRFVEAGVSDVDAEFIEEQKASRLLCDHGALTQRQVADLLKLRSGAAVSLQLRRLADEARHSRPLRKQLARIREELQNSQR